MALRKVKDAYGRMKLQDSETGFWFANKAEYNAWKKGSDNNLVAFRRKYRRR